MNTKFKKIVSALLIASMTIPFAAFAEEIESATVYDYAADYDASNPSGTTKVWNQGYYDTSNTFTEFTVSGAPYSGWSEKMWYMEGCTGDKSWNCSSIGTGDVVSAFCKHGQEPAILFTAPADGIYVVNAEIKAPGINSNTEFDGIKYKLERTDTAANVEAVYPAEGYVEMERGTKSTLDSYAYLKADDVLGIRFNCMENDMGDEFAVQSYQIKPLEATGESISFENAEEYLSYFTQPAYADGNNVQFTAVPAESAEYDKIVYLSSNTAVIDSADAGENTTGEFLIKGVTTTQAYWSKGTAVNIFALMIKDGAVVDMAQNSVYVCNNNIGRLDPVYRWYQNPAPEQGWARGPVWDYVSTTAVNTTAANAEYTTEDAYMAYATSADGSGRFEMRYTYTDDDNGRIRLYGEWAHAARTRDIGYSFTAPRSGRVRVYSQTYPKALGSIKIRYSIRKNDTVVYPTEGEWKELTQANVNDNFGSIYVDLSAGDKLYFLMSPQTTVAENGTVSYASGPFQWSPAIEYVDTISFAEGEAFMSYCTQAEYSNRNLATITAQATIDLTENERIVYTSSDSEIMESVNDEGANENTTGKFIIKGQTSTAANNPGTPVVITATLKSGSQEIGVAEKNIYIRNNDAGIHGNVYNWWAGGLTGAEQGWDLNGPVWYYGLDSSGAMVNAADSNMEFDKYTLKHNSGTYGSGYFMIQSGATYRLDTDWKHLSRTNDTSLSFKAPRSGMVKISAGNESYPESLGTAANGATGLNYAIRQNKEVLWPDDGSEWCAVEVSQQVKYDDIYTYVNEGDYIHFVVAVKDNTSTNAAYEWSPRVTYINEIGEEKIEKNTSAITYSYTPDKDLENVSMICAAFDKDGKLLETTETKATFRKNRADSVNFELAAKNAYDADYVKFFMWDDLEGMVPVKDKAEYDLEIEKGNPDVYDGAAYSITHDSVRLSWKSDKEADSFGVFLGNNLITEVERNECRISGLLDDADYEFEIKAKLNGEWSGESHKISFKTGKPEHKAVTDMYVMNDSHVLSQNQVNWLSRALLDAKNERVSAFVINGDITNDGMKSQVDWTKRTVAEFADYPVYYTIGNHDIRWMVGGLEEAVYHFTQGYGMPGLYYDTWVDGYHLMMLGSEEDLNDYARLSDTQLDWLEEKAAERADSNKPIIVFLHQPMRYVETEAMQARLKEIFAKYPQMVFTTAHTHTKKTVVTENECTYLDAANGNTGLTTILEFYDDGIVVKGRDLDKNIISSEDFVSGVSAAQAQGVINNLRSVISAAADSETKTAASNLLLQAESSLSSDRLENGIWINKLNDAVYALENTADVYDVSGMVSCGGEVMMGVKISLYDGEEKLAETVSGFDGFYMIKDAVSDGEYQIVAEDFGVSKDVSVFGGAAANVKLEIAATEDTTAPVWEENAQLEVTNKTANTITVAIPALEDASAYAMTVDGKYVETVTSTEYTFKNLKPERSYTLGVIAADKYANKSGELVAESETKEAALAPVWNSGALTADENTVSGFRLSWPTAENASGYVLTSGNLPIANIEDNEYTVTGLDAAVSRTFSVKAYNMDGIFGEALEVTASSLADTKAPEWNGFAWDVARVVAYDKNETGLSLAWFGASDDSKIKEYKVYMNGSLIGTAEDTKYTLSGLSADAEYTFRIEAVDIYGNESVTGPECTAAPAVNLAFGKTVTSNGGSTPEAVVDGNVLKSTGWRVSVLGEGTYVQIDLGSQTAIENIELIPNSPEGAEEGQRFKIMLSNNEDFADSVTLCQYGDNPISKQTPVIIENTDSQAYRYVRYQITGTNTFWLPEIRVY